MSMTSETRPDTATSVLNPTVIDDMVEFTFEECERKGSELNHQYVNADPFPHIAIDNFLPTELLRRVVSEFPSRQEGRFADAQSRLKTGYQLEKITSRFITHLMYALNSAQMLTFVEKLTGIDGLLPDPYFAGAGLHETARGGHLSIHADFNVNERLRLLRRVNLIIFLNEDWNEEYGGNLELWDRQMKERKASVPPTIGNAVLFNTDSDAFHGHPEPLDCPDGVFRRSIALYYYVAPMTGVASVKSHTTIFQVRPGSKDKSASKLRRREILREWCPPILWRLTSKP